MAERDQTFLQMTFFMKSINPESRELLARRSLRVEFLRRRLALRGVLVPNRREEWLLKIVGEVRTTRMEFWPLTI